MLTSYNFVKEYINGI